MGLLITLILIMGNTFVSVQRSGPQDRNFGTIEIWMIGCSTFMSFAMIEYAIILLKMKNEHDNGCELEYKNKKMNKRCCKNNEFKELDRWCLILIPLLFLAFNVVFWSSVHKIDDFPAKSTSSGNTLTSSVFLWGSQSPVSQVTSQPAVEIDQKENGNEQLQNGSASSITTTTPTSTSSTLTATPISSSKFCFCLLMVDKKGQGTTRYYEIISFYSSHL